MGRVYVDLRLGHFEQPDIEEINAEALVDSRAINLCLPASMVAQLKLKQIGVKRAILADGQAQEVAVVGSVEVHLMGRRTVTTAMVMGDIALLGAIPMEDMDILIDPARQRVIPADPSCVTASARRAVSH